MLSYERYQSESMRLYTDLNGQLNCSPVNYFKIQGNATRSQYRLLFILTRCPSVEALLIELGSATFSLHQI